MFLHQTRLLKLSSKTLSFTGMLMYALWNKIDSVLEYFDYYMALWLRNSRQVWMIDFPIEHSTFVNPLFNYLLETVENHNGRQ